MVGWLGWVAASNPAPSRAKPRLAVELSLIAGKGRAGTPRSPRAPESPMLSGFLGDPNGQCRISLAQTLPRPPLHVASLTSLGVPSQQFPEPPEPAPSEHRDCR